MSAPARSIAAVSSPRRAKIRRKDRGGDQRFGHGPPVTGGKDGRKGGTKPAFWDAPPLVAGPSPTRHLPQRRFGLWPRVRRVQDNGSIGRQPARTNRCGKLRPIFLQRRLRLVQCKRTRLRIVKIGLFEAHDRERAAVWRLIGDHVAAISIDIVKAPDHVESGIDAASAARRANPCTTSRP